MVMPVRQLGVDDLCIHQVCLSGQCNFASSLSQLVAAGIKRTALWNPMIENCGQRQALSFWNDSGLRADSLCVAELFAGPDKLRRMLDRADLFKARTLVLITGGLEAAGVEGGIDEARKYLPSLLAQADELARPYNVQLAFEPLHPMVCGFRSIVSSLGEALDLLDQLGAAHEVGLAIDTYALWWEDQSDQKLLRASKRILNYHVSDWLADTSDLRLDRGMPGDGQINLLQWRAQLEQFGYRGGVEIEIFSCDRWWKQAPESMLKQIIERLNLAY
tara:strand:+ start:201 stop:1025 length:825 start_codon:yes stop_codon:yes gene_type:complete